jgi:hypothetical protein
MRRLKVLSTSALPPLYDAWMTELLRGPLPIETEATCDRCVMCVDGALSAGEKAFDASTKCCTYVPAIPNFLVGRILSDRDPAARAGKQSVEERMRARVAVTPLGVGVTAPKNAHLRLAARHDGFGRTPSLRCPHYVEEGGRCGIWKNRTSTCATWFCKHVRGAVGGDFWHEGIEALLRALELALSRWCVLQLDPGESALRRLFPRDPSAEPDGQFEYEPVVYRGDWGSWVGRERAFFLECARLVGELRWADVVRIGGVEIAARAKVARTLYDAVVSTDMPRALRPGPIQLPHIGAHATRVTSYNPNDPLDLPNALVALLPRFDGRPTQKVLADLEANEGIAIDDALVRRLVDFEVLVSADDAPPLAAGKARRRR